MRNSRRQVSLLLISLLSFVVAACGGSTPTKTASTQASPPTRTASGGTAQSRTNDLTIGTCGVSGYWFQSGTVLAQLINQHVPGVHAKAVPTSCTPYNIEGIDKGKFQLGISTTDNDYVAYTATGRFAHKKPLTFAALSSWYKNYFHIFTLNPHISTLQELKGKRVAIGNPAGGNNFVARQILKSVGLRPGVNITTLNVNLGTGLNLLKSGQADAVFWNMPLLNPAMRELVAVRRVYLIPVGQAQLQALPPNVRKGYTLSDIPAGSYPHQLKAVPALSNEAVLDASTKLAPATVGKVLNALFSHLSQFRAALPATAKQLSKATALNGIIVPLHPGAIQYYRQHNFPGLAAAERRGQTALATRKASLKGS